MHKYSLGCAFTVSDLFTNFPYSKLSINCELCERAIGDRHRQILVKKIFQASFKLVIQDIVERNVTFWFPLTGSVLCNMHMKRVTGAAFQKLRKAGKWNDVDFIESNFTGYEIGFYMLGKRTPRVKTVYVDKKVKSAITKYTNEGKLYGDGLIDTKISDYYQLMFELFPNVPQQDIKRILIYAWKSLYLHNSYGGDVLIRPKFSWFYIGLLRKNSLLHFHYYKLKLIKKLRIVYRRKKIPWDGYYYFALSDKLYLSYLSQKKTKGRPRKYFNFGPVYLYLILDECRVAESGYKYIFRIPMISRIGIRLYNQELIGNAELFEIRPPLKFKDVLVNDNEYEFL